MLSLIVHDRNCAIVMVLVAGSGVRPIYCSSFRPFGNVNTRSMRELSTILMLSKINGVVKAEPSITALKYSTGVPNGVSAVISATYVVAFRDAM